LLQILAADYALDENVLVGSQSHEAAARECQHCAIKLLNSLLRRAFLAADTVEPTWNEQLYRMQGLLGI